MLYVMIIHPDSSQRHNPMFTCTAVPEYVLHWLPLIKIKVFSFFDKVLDTKFPQISEKKFYLSYRPGKTPLKQAYIKESTPKYPKPPHTLPLTMLFYILKK